MYNMTSIKATLSELDLFHARLDLALHSYRSIVGDLALYPIMPLEEITAPMRTQLETLAAEAETVPIELLPGNAAAVRAVLHEYQGAVTEFVEGLQAERSLTERTLQELVAVLNQADDDHDGRIRSTVDHLRAAAKSPDARAIREILRTAADSIEQSVDQIRRQHQTVISSMHREIRSLQRQLGATGAEAGPDNITQIWTRDEIRERILAAKPGEFAVVILRMRGVRLASVNFGPEVATELSQATVVRLRNLLPVDTAIARVGEEEFVAMVPASDSGVATSALCRTIAEHLPGAYACTTSGKLVRPSIEITVCAVDRSLRDTSEQILKRVDNALLRI